jgi:hypothetical protein
MSTFPDKVIFNKNELGALPVHNVLAFKGIYLGDTLKTAATHPFGGWANCAMHALSFPDKGRAPTLKNVPFAPRMKKLNDAFTPIRGNSTGLKGKENAQGAKQIKIVWNINQCRIAC